MRNHSCMRVQRVVLLACICASLVSCASLHAPNGTLPEPENIAESVFGGWVYLRMFDNYTRIQGEFIAVEDSSIIIMALTSSNGFAAQRVDRSQIEYASIEIHTTNSTSYGLWTAAGTLSTLSHGWFLTISAPTWAIWGSVATANIHHGGEFSEWKPDDSWWRSMTIHARFPQGMPRGIALDRLKSFW